MAVLIDLPAELLSRIACYLFYENPSYFACYDAYEDHGFCSLRLSCRVIEAKTRYAFERAVFSTVVVTLHAKSLQRLHNIASQDRFGRLIKELVVTKARRPVFDQVTATSESVRQHEYASYGVIELPREGDDGVYPNNGLTLKRRVRLGLQEIFAKFVAMAPNFQKLMIGKGFMASFWLDSPSRQDQLNEAARHMYQSTTEGFHDNRAHDVHEDAGSDSNPGSDMDSLHGENEDYDDDKHEDPYHIEAYVYADYLLFFIMNAAHQRGIQLSSLRFSDPKALIRARTFVELVPALQSLQHIDISLNVDSITKLVRKDKSALHEVDGQPVANSFGRALGRLHSLRTLTLSFDVDYCEDDRHPMLAEGLSAIGQHSFPHLANIDIRYASFEPTALYRFLCNQRSVLQRLYLEYILLPTVEEWRPTFALLLGEAPKFSRLDCRKLLARSDLEIMLATELDDRSDMSRRGRARISDKLQELLSYFDGTA